MMKLEIKIFILTVLNCLTSSSLAQDLSNPGDLEIPDVANRTQVNHRAKRFLGLFNVVQFANSACNSTEAGKEGLCYTNNECTGMRGRPSGTCALGFGVCCIFEFSCEAAKSGGQEIFFFQNPKFPVGEDTPSICLFGISVASPSVCQIRLDFLEFELDGGSAVDQPCNKDSMEVFGGDGASNLGMGKLCGRNTGQHFYIPVRSQQSSPLLRISTDGRSSSSNFTTPKYKWNIKVTQIDCLSNTRKTQELMAPSGCLQYFTERTGTVSSFNWNPTVPRHYMKNQHYAICFRRTENDCKMELKRSASAPAFSTLVGSFYNAITMQPAFPQGKCFPENGCSASECISTDVPTAMVRSDYLEILNGFYYKQLTNNVQINSGPSQKFVLSTIYCGVGLGRDQVMSTTAALPDGLDERSGVIVQGPGPFTIVFHTDDIAVPAIGIVNNLAQNEVGFSLDFKVSTTCSPLAIDSA